MATQWLGGISRYQPSPVPPSHCPTLPLSLPGCGWGPLGPPRSARPLAICCSRGTSTAVSHDSDCRSPGRSSSLAVARSLQGGAGAREGWGAQATSRGLSHLWSLPLSPSPPQSTRPGPRNVSLAARSHMLKSFLHSLFKHMLLSPYPIGTMYQAPYQRS